MNKRFKVAGIGEVLWDQLPLGDVLGGAPANVGYHAGQLGAESYIISAVGNDKLGDEIISRLKANGINLLISRVAYPTGTVKVTLDAQGVPDFVITKDAAWDYIELTSESSNLASQLDAVCFGSLAQRNTVSHNAIVKFLNLVPENVLKIFDINLRQNFYNKQLINESLTISNILKINDDLLAEAGTKLTENATERKRVKEEVEFMEKEHSKKKAEEVSQLEKDDLEKLRKELSGIENSRKEILETYGNSNKIVKQVIDLALLANNMLRGEDLSTFVKRSVELL